MASASSDPHDRVATEFDELATALNLSESTREIATTTYRRAADSDLLIGRSIAATVAASIYYACRVEKEPILLDEVAGASTSQKSEISNTYRFLSDELSLIAPPPHPFDFIESVADELDADTALKVDVETVLNRALDDGINNGTHPKGVTAAAFYVVSRVVPEHTPYTQAEVAEVGDVCKVTVRSRARELLSAIDVLDNAIDVDTLEDEATITVFDSLARATPTNTPDGETTADDPVSTDGSNEVVVTIDDWTATCTHQYEAMVMVTNRLIDQYDLLDAIELPYYAPQCTNPLLAAAPSQFAKDETGATRWRELESGHVLNTRMPLEGKDNRLRDLARVVDVSLTVDW